MIIKQSIVHRILILIFLFGILFMPVIICANSCETDDNMNVDIQLIRGGSFLQVINHNNFSLNNVRYELTANVSNSPFICLDPQLLPRSSRNYDLFSFKNSDREGFNYKEMEILGISMYAETVEGKILTAEWDFR